MSIDRALQQALKNLGKRATPTLSVEVVSVNKEKGTCRVFEDGLEFEVRLASVINEDKNRFYLFPKVGSSVLIAPIEEDINRCHVVGYSEIESFSFCTEQTEFQIDQNGFLLKRNETNFKTLLNELLTELKNAIIQTPSGVGNFAPNNKRKFEQINEKINQLFK